MPTKKEQSLKRARQSHGEDGDAKKPRRSQRISSQQFDNNQLPSPVTHQASAATDRDFKEGTEEPPEASQLHNQNNNNAAPRTPPPSSPQAPANHGLSSPPNDTQPFTQSQYRYPPLGMSHEVKDEEGEGVWGYLLPVDHNLGDTMVLRRRSACPLPQAKNVLGVKGRRKVKGNEYKKQEEKYEETTVDGIAAGGYLIGRHPECDRMIPIPTISNRHCLFYYETKAGTDIAVVEDLSANGTFVNECIVGRNKRRELRDGDEIAILDSARFIFRYPRSRNQHGFNQQYSVQTALGKGHFATVYLCVERNSGMKYAVKKFEKRSGPGERSKVEGLQQEIGVLMGVSHPNLLCLKDVFDEADGVYLVLELATEGELFNWIVMKQKLSEADTRKLFVQIFQALKYLHERNIVHRDIKPENILLIDPDLSVKLADFGLAKIIGEESFTTTLCGTPSYVAPEILESSNHRRYTRAVDVWSAGVVLYICLCGFPPFSDELYSQDNPYTLSQQIKLGRFDYPSPYWDPVSDLALDLIDRMLTVDVDRRISVDECLEHPWITGHTSGTSGPFHGTNVNGTTQTHNTNNGPSAKDSTDSLTHTLGNLDFSKRKPRRERTLLSDINDITLARTIDVRDCKDEDAEKKNIKVFSKNQGKIDPSVKEKQKELAAAVAETVEMDGANGEESAIDAHPTMQGKSAPEGKKGEPSPSANRDPEEFSKLGGKGDAPLFETRAEGEGGSVYPLVDVPMVGGQGGKGAEGLAEAEGRRGD